MISLKVKIHCRWPWAVEYDKVEWQFSIFNSSNSVTLINDTEQFAYLYSFIYHKKLTTTWLFPIIFPLKYIIAFKKSWLHDSKRFSILHQFSYIVFEILCHVAMCLFGWRAILFFNNSFYSQNLIVDSSKYKAIYNLKYLKDVFELFVLLSFDWFFFDTIVL